MEGRAATTVVSLRLACVTRFGSSQAANRSHSLTCCASKESILSPTPYPKLWLMRYVSFGETAGGVAGLFLREIGDAENGAQQEPSSETVALRHPVMPVTNGFSG